MLDQLESELRRHGIEIKPEEIKWNEKHFTRNKGQWLIAKKWQFKGKEYAWAGFGDYSQDLKTEWKSYGQLNKDEAAAADIYIKAAKQLEKETRHREQLLIAKELEKEWESFDQKGITPYMERKLITELYGCRVKDNNGSGPTLIVPMRDENGKFWNYQRIFAKRTDQGDKFFSKGARIKGCFHILSGSSPAGSEGVSGVHSRVRQISNSETIVICEGLSTAGSLTMAIKEKAAVVCAFNAGNLLPVAQAFRKKYPTNKIILAADNDAFNKTGNIGVEKATEAALAIGASVVIPTFKEPKEGLTDFNDLHATEGIEAVIKYFFKEEAKEKVSEEPPKQEEHRKEKTQPKSEQNHFKFYKIVLTEQEDGSFKKRLYPDYPKMADYCFEQKNMCFEESSSLFFNGKYWELIGKNYLNNFIWTQNEGVIQPMHLDLFAKSIKAKCHVNSFNFLDKTAKINCQNGIVNVLNGEIEPNNYQYLFKYCMPMEFNKEAIAPTWEAFLKEIFLGKEELIELMRDIFGYVLMGGDPFLHRAFVLYGTGRNGKSTLLDVLRSLVGRGSYSTVSMAKLDKEFSIVSMDGKLANIVEEAPINEINAEIFKAMVGGGEVQASRKGIDEYTMRVNARFLFACNDMPVFKDRSAGLEDRLVFIPFNRYFEENERDTSIKGKLAAEMQGILNWALVGAKRIAESKTLKIPIECLAVKEEYKKSSDPLYSWFDETFEVSASGKKRSVDSVYLEYKNYCTTNGHSRFCSKDNFIKRLKPIIAKSCKDLGIEFKSESRILDASGKRVRAFDFLAEKVFD